MLLVVACFSAARPASLIKPRSSRSWQRLMLSSAQWLRLQRGERRCTRRPSGNFLHVESIHLPLFLDLGVFILHLLI